MISLHGKGLAFAAFEAVSKGGEVALPRAALINAAQAVEPRWGASVTPEGKGGLT